MIHSKQPWHEQIAALEGLAAPDADRMLRHSKVVDLPPKTKVFGPGDTAETMFLILSGTVRVQQSSENGHEIVLYRIHSGETCVLTTSCLLSHEPYSATGITETEVRAVTIPRATFDQLIATSTVFRDFVFASFSKRITDLLMMVAEVAFQRIDVRLAQALLRLSVNDDRIATTHQELSVELGTAREVISRQLQEFQRRGWIALSRGSVEILHKDPIQDLADPHGRPAPQPTHPLPLQAEYRKENHGN